MTVTGLSDSARLVGFYGVETKKKGVTTFHTAILAWDDPTQTFLDVTHDIGNISDGMATCVDDFGWIGGVCWTAEVISQQQLGFIWLDGSATTFASPEGGNIDTVVAVNSSGQAVGTYIGDSGLKRAFFWDGTRSTDLGDLDNPDTSFIWPVSLSDAGQVVGTLYLEDSPIVPPPTIAFAWQPGGTMSAIDANNQFIATAAIGQNDAGSIIGSFLASPRKGSRSLVLGGFVSIEGAGSLTDLSSLGGGGTLPFFVNDEDVITGTSYASDNTLHLFDWQGFNPMIDLGNAWTYSDDEAFQLTSVNQGGDAAGFVTDARSGVHVFVRAGGDNIVYLLESVTNNLPDILPDTSPGQQALINDFGLIACPGTDRFQGSSEILLLTPDADANGLPDGWEQFYFHGPVADPNAPAPSGDGLSILEAYRQGVSPFDFYDGQTPTVAVVGGSPQTGPPGGFVPLPLVVCVTDVNGIPYRCAPVNFTVSQGGGQLQTSSSATPGLSITLRTDTSGQAQIFFQLPNATNNTSRITATTGSVSPLPAATFLELSDDGTGSFGSPFDASNVIATLNSDGSAYVTWTNNVDPSDQSPITIQYGDANGNLVVIATVPAGTTSYHIPAR